MNLATAQGAASEHHPELCDDCWSVACYEPITGAAAPEATP